MNLRGRIRRLERESRGELIEIPLEGGGVARFTQEDYKAAFMNAMARLGAGDDAPPRHPLLEACRNSSDPSWRGLRGLSDLDFEGATEPIPDLSEP